MTRIFEVTTICPSKDKGRDPVGSTYRVAARDAEQAIAKVKKAETFSEPWEKVMTVALLASTD